MLSGARTVSADARPPIEWRQGDAASLPFPDRHFDAVFCEQRVQFFSEPLTALREMRRALEAALADHADDDGVVCRVEAYVVMAR
jgi:ubiquinone/menaquinone biosynthesis C-methylase UbiE